MASTPTGFGVRYPSLSAVLSGYGLMTSFPYAELYCISV